MAVCMCETSTEIYILSVVCMLYNGFWSFVYGYATKTLLAKPGVDIWHQLMILYYGIFIYYVLSICSAIFLVVSVFTAHMQCMRTFLYCGAVKIGANIVLIVTKLIIFLTTTAQNSYFSVGQAAPLLPSQLLEMILGNVIPAKTVQLKNAMGATTVFSTLKYTEWILFFGMPATEILIDCFVLWRLKIYAEKMSAPPAHQLAVEPGAEPAAVPAAQRA